MSCATPFVRLSSLMYCAFRHHRRKWRVPIFLQGRCSASGVRPMSMCCLVCNMRKAEQRTVGLVQYADAASIQQQRRKGN